MIRFLGIIFSNIIGYDLAIFVIAILQVCVYLRARTAINRIYVYMHPADYVPSHEDPDGSTAGELPKEPDIVNDLEEATRYYTLYGNITAIFPLMGILGTVISLIGMVGDMANFQGSFYLALTSTLWGLVFAIGSKFADTWLSSRLEDDERAVELYLERKGRREPKEK